MDALLKHATQLANQKAQTIDLPIQRRIAYVVSHGQSYASNGYAIRTQGIAHALNQHGFETLCFVRPGRPWELGADHKSTRPEVSVNGVRYIHRRWLAGEKPKNEIEHLEKSVEYFIELFKVYRPSGVLAASNAIVGLPAWVAAKRLGLPFYNEVRGFWELSRDAREPGYKNTEAFKVEAERDTFVAKQAQAVFTLNQPMKEELVKRGVKAANIALVPNGVSKLPEIKPVDSVLKKKLGIEHGDKVVGYVGSFNAYEGLDVLLKACAELVHQGEKIKLLLVGDDQPVTDAVGNQRTLSTAAEDASWLIQVGRVPHERVTDYYALIDTIVIPRKRLPVCELVSPMKAAEALAYGKRLVVSNVAPLAKHADKYEGVVSFTAGNAASLAQAFQASVKLPTPKPSTELLFSTHTEPMVKALKGEGSEPAAQPMATPKTAQAGETVHIALKQLTLNGDSKKTVEGVIKVPVPGATLELSAAVVYRLKSAATSRKAVLLFDFLDRQGNKVATIPGVGVAAVFKQHFRYLNANSKSVDAKLQEVFKLKLPEAVARVSVSVAGLGITDEEQVELSIQGRCYSEEAIRKKKEQELKQQTLPKPAVHDPNKKIRTSELNVVCILDELTSECLSHEVNMIKITREEWQEQLEKVTPDFLLVESCWRGNDNNWGTLTKGSGGGRKLGGLLRYCKEQGIPTVFWNKEDPPHYDKFGAVAALFDVTITTDINMVPNYKKDFGITAHALSFAAQPKIHNPALGVVRLNKAVFAGSYYSEREDRCNGFHDIVADLEAVGVGYDIYDRNHMSGIVRFQYPDRYAANIIGKLPPEELWKVNNGYKYQINLNSVTDSSTMFARRVYESLASGTPVISNASKGVSELFGDLVIMNDSSGTIADKVRELESSKEKYNSLAKEGVRRIMREHTYSHRIKEICDLIGVDVALDQPEITAIAIANNSSDVGKAKSIFWNQTYPNKKLFISLEKFTGAHVFLNQSDSQVSYAMALGRDFYDRDESFYLSERVVRLDLSENVSSEYLEDAVYWGDSDD
ncbi:MULTISPECIES: glycosyltransferase [Halomonas]|uniref:glycosyltransferase n=1 Tax=Halomonas TaxID=2745 RepID=UPI0018683234|nr:glycosyltransferase [Halomonas citrativorans]